MNSGARLPQLPPHLGEDAHEMLERIVAIDERRKKNGSYSEEDWAYMLEVEKFLAEYGRAIGFKP